MGGCSWHHTTTSFVSVHFIVLLCEAVVWFSFDYEKFSSISSLYFRLVVATLKVFEANQIELELRFSLPLPPQHPQIMRQRFVVVYQPLCKSLFVHLLYTAAPRPRITVGWISCYQPAYKTLFNVHDCRFMNTTWGYAPLPPTNSFSWVDVFSTVFLVE